MYVKHNFKKGSTQVILIILVVILLASGCLFAYYYQNKSGKNDQEALNSGGKQETSYIASPKPSPTSPIDDTSSWQTYSLEKYFLTFKYPLEQFCPREPISESTNNPQGIKEGIIQINFRSIHCEDRVAAITIASNNISETDLLVDPSWTRTETVIGTFKGAKYIKRSDITGTDIIWFVNNGKNSFVIGYNSGGATDIKTMEKIVSSIEFIN